MAPLHPLTLPPLPAGSIQPRGWLQRQLLLQATGLTGHLDEFWPSIKHSRWIGGPAEGWERGPYWLDGLIPLAFLLADDPEGARLKTKAQHWVDTILQNQHEDGWLGAKDDTHEGIGESELDPWPLFVLFKAFTQWQEATGDGRIIPALLRCSRRVHQLLQEKPLTVWAKMRWADLVVSLHWLYERTGERWLLDLAQLAQQQGFDWNRQWADFPYKERTNTQGLEEGWKLPLHGVNNAMGVKSGAVWGRQSGRDGDFQGSFQALKVLQRYHGQVTGMFSGDEHLAGLSPSQGTETCTVVELMYSIEQMLAITGDVALGDHLERIVFNALPAACGKTMWNRQYDQQPNQVLVSRAKRNWVSNGDDANLFSLEGNFGCCTANLHQGWPKFANHLWMQRDGGLVAVAYAPCQVTTQVNNTRVCIEERTEYPFREHVEFLISTARPVKFPLQLRIPAWAQGATLSINKEATRPVAAGAFHTEERQWKIGDRIVLHLPMSLRQETRFNNAVALLRGPLVFSLKIGAEFRKLRGEEPHADWEIHPTTPWNYALSSLDHDLNQVQVQEAPIPSIPFDPQHAPLTLELRAQQLPTWQIEQNSAAPPPPSPVKTGEAEETIKLIPYGSTYLRVTEFPHT